MAAVASTLQQFPRAREANKAEDEDLKSALDPLIARAMQEWHVPGAVVLVVQGSEIVFTKGYGYADLDKHVPVTPDTTVFHVHSLSKLFTATAVMQLVEQRKLDLDRDVNLYLTRLQISDPYSQPVTVRHLLTHTAGFDSDQREIGGWARSNADWLPLDAYLAKRAPSPMWRPGERFLYTNAAYDLLGLIVQDVSGVPFAEYMAEHVLQPLDMERSTFEQPPRLTSDLALTYHYADGQQTVVPDGQLLNVPAAGLSATAADMAHFMIAHLQNGRYADKQILQASTLRDMHQSHFTYESDQPGTAYGFRLAFSPRTRNGARDPPPAGTPVLWHGGGGPRAPTSQLQLEPQDGFGLFIAFNSDEFRFLDQVLAEFTDRVEPSVPDSSEATPRQTITASNSDIGRFAGIYRPVDYSRTTISKLLLLQADDLPQVIVSGDVLGIRWLPDAPTQPDPLVHVEPLVFTSEDGRFRFTFVADQTGKTTGMDWGNLFVLEKVPWYETVGFQRALYATFLLMFLMTAVAWPLHALLTRIRRPVDGRTGGSVGVPAVLAGLLAPLTAGLNALFLLGLLLVLSRALDLDLQFGMPPTVVALLAIPMLTTALALGLVLLAIPVWRMRTLSTFQKGVYSLVTLSALGFLPFIVYWNLLGFRW